MPPSDPRPYRARAIELLRSVGADDLAEEIVENIEAAAEASVLRTMADRVEKLTLPRVNRETVDLLREVFR